ncbi:MAG: hypothetical protein M5R40_02210 [Anaerolineae bacterium]|nr:hypothetical protein [Anaerolineae bacterium]
MRRLTLILVTVLVAVLVPAAAQVGDPLSCADEVIAAAIAKNRAFLDEAESALAAGDSDAALRQLMRARALLDDIVTMCNGLVFEGTDRQVFGPVSFPVGVYRATFTTPGVGTVKVEVIEGECLSGRLFNIQRGQAVEGAEASFPSEGCFAMLDVAAVGASWSLRFEPLQ